MKVWILMQGEMQEGGSVEGVYATRELGHGAFTLIAERIFNSFGIDDVSQAPDGSLHLSGGCDWLSLEPHEVTTLLEIPARTENNR